MAGEVRRPRSLSEAHEERGLLYPGRGASAEHWRAYYLRSAELYDAAAEVDRAHRLEARWWADQQRAYAGMFTVAPEGQEDTDADEAGTHTAGDLAGGLSA